MVIQCEEEENINQTETQIKEAIANELGLKQSSQIVLGDRVENNEPSFEWTSQPILAKDGKHTKKNFLGKKDAYMALIECPSKDKVEWSLYYKSEFLSGNPCDSIEAAKYQVEEWCRRHKETKGRF